MGCKQLPVGRQPGAFCRSQKSFPSLQLGLSRSVQRWPLAPAVTTCWATEARAASSWWLPLPSPSGHARCAWLFSPLPAGELAIFRDLITASPRAFQPRSGSRGLPRGG